MKKGALILPAALAFGLGLVLVFSLGRGRAGREEDGGGPEIPVDLVGRWLDANGVFGYEFTSDGKVSQIIQGRTAPAGSVIALIPPDNGKPGTIEVSVEYTGPVAYRIEGDTLVFSNASSTWWATSYVYTKTEAAVQESGVPQQIP
jgi:hypothetical protein